MTHAIRLSRLSAFLPLALLWLCAGRASAVPITLYSTQFEPADGFVVGYTIAGNDGWLSDDNDSNGIVTNYIEGLGQQAYLGYYPPAADDVTEYVWRPVNYTPVSAPVVNFSVEMAIIDSTIDRPNRDSFRWEIFNAAGQSLFSLLFDNSDLSIWHGSDDGYDYDTGWGFTNSTAYTLEVTMNLASNSWDAWLNETQIVTNQPITTTGAPLTFGDADAVWEIGVTNQAGDNYLLFDNYSVWVDVPLEIFPSVEGPLPLGDGQQFIQVNGAENENYAIEASTNLIDWTTLKTNTVSGGHFDFLDSTAVGLPQRFYRARWVP